MAFNEGWRVGGLEERGGFLAILKLFYEINK